MPLFRCGGTSISSIAASMVYEKIHSLFGDNFNFSYNITKANVDNAFGSSGTGQILNTNGCSSSFSALKKFFEYYNYTVTMAPSSTAYPDQFAILWYTGGTDPKESGGGSYVFFNAKYSAPSNGMSSFEEKMVNRVRSAVGDNYTMSYIVSTGVEGEGANKERHDIVRGGGLGSLATLFLEAGYNVANDEQNNRYDNVGTSTRTYTLEWAHGTHT